MTYRGAHIYSAIPQSIPCSPLYSPNWKFLTFENVGINSDAALDPADRAFEIVQETGPNRTSFVMKGSGVVELTLSGIWLPRLSVSPNTFFPGECQLVIVKNQNTPLPFNGYNQVVPDNRPFIEGTTTDLHSMTHPMPFVDGDKFSATACQYQKTGSQAIDIQTCGFAVKVLETS